MDYKQFLCAIAMLVLLMHSTAAQSAADDRSAALKNKLIEEAPEFDLKIDPSNIQMIMLDNGGLIASVSLLDGVDITSDDIEKGDVYVCFQCVEFLKDCYIGKLVSADEKQAQVELVDSTGQTVATETVGAAANGREKRAALVASDQLVFVAKARVIFCISISPGFIICYDQVITIIVVARNQQVGSIDSDELQQ